MDSADAPEGAGLDGEDLLAEYLAGHTYFSEVAGERCVVEVAAINIPEAPIGRCAICDTPITHRGDAGWRHDWAYAVTGCRVPGP